MKRVHFFSLIIGGLIGGALALAAHPADKMLRMRRYLEASVYKIFNASTQSFGTGFVIEYTGKKLMVTNAHVCSTEPYLMSANSQSSNKDYILFPELVEPGRDICLSTIIDGKKLKALKLAERMPEIGETVYTIGHPHAMAMRIGEGQIDAEEERTIEAAPEFCSIFSAQPCMLKIDSFLVSLFVIPGQSGSPLVNAKGEVVGLVFATNLETRTGLAVTLNAMKEALADYLQQELKSRDNSAKNGDVLNNSSR